MSWQLDYRCGAATLPIELLGVLPETVNALTQRQVEHLPLVSGNQFVPLAEIFDVTRTDSDELVFTGELPSVHSIGAKMTSGRLRVEGAAGRHVGSEMRGGHLRVTGNVSDWAGAEMQGGYLQIEGHAGARLGAAYHGSPRGMTGGTICVRGHAGDEVGHSLRRGVIAVGGDVGPLAGFNLWAGTVLVLGDLGPRAGAGMRRGTIACWGRRRPQLLASFAAGCRLHSLTLQLILRQLDVHFGELGIDWEAYAAVDLCIYHGDQLRGGRGEILTREFV